MKQAMVRSVRDDFQALLMCNAMLAVGAEPISVVHQPTLRDGVTGQPFPASLQFLVFAKVADEAMIQAVDDEYERVAK